MTNPMKVLVAYDGSAYAEQALSDLQRAGLPSAVEAVVLSVADLWLLPQDETAAPQVVGSSVMHQARNSALEMQQRAAEFAENGARRLRSLFPHWQVRAETAVNSPTWAIVLKAEEWGADLIVVGSHGYSQLGRWVLGSVSQGVVTHATCTVRVSRESSTLPDRPLRILVGVDGSPEAELAVQTVASRHWPAGTDIRIAMVVNPTFVAQYNQSQWAGKLPPADSPQVPASMSTGYLEGVQAAEEFDGKVAALLDGYVDLAGKNPKRASASALLLKGDPKRLLLEEAAKWGADCIFVGSRGLSRWERLLLGSVSAAVATRAECSVEVVRRATPTA